jgi:mono/diheme cytochrome c family protein
MSRLRGALLPIGVVALVAGGAIFGFAQGRDSSGEQEQAAPLTQFGPPPRQTATAQTSDQEAREEARSSAKVVFGHACGTCHTLAAAGTKAVVGPTLDGRRLTAASVRAQIANGSVDNAMPKNILTGRTADRVAAYVARVSRPSRGS